MKNKINCILLIDDYEPNNVFSKHIICDEELCNNVKIAIDADEAMNYLYNSFQSGNSESFPLPDLIFLDLNMPRMNGFEFLDEFIKLDKNLKSAIKIIILTTSLNPDDKIRAMEYNEIAGFENKPISKEIIINSIRKIV